MSKFYFKKVSSRDISLLCDNLFMLLNSGVSLLEVLHMLSIENENKYLRDSLKDIYNHVRNGMSLSQSFYLHKEIYPELFRSMVKVGEESGNLDEIFYNLSKYYEKEQYIINKIKSSLAYPTMVVISIIICLSIMIFKVIPSLGALIQDINSDLPWYTKALLKFSSFAQNNILSIVLIISMITFYVIMFCIVMPQEGKGKFLYKNKAFKNFYNIKFIRSLEILIRSGNSIMQSLELSKSIISNDHYEEVINDIIKDIKRGMSLSKAIENRNIYKSMVICILKVGEESGRIEKSLESSTKLLSSEIENNIYKQVSYIQPLTLVIMAVIVLFMILIIVIPLLNSMSNAAI